jgi:tRNA threonylcarbamoyladenosine biosynthesis protein TsaB
VLTLTVSTSSAKGSLCLGDSQNILGHETWQKKTSHSEVVTQTLEELLHNTGVQLQDIQQLVCSTGPGSFTGLRVGLSVTRSLAYSLQIPIISMNDGLAIALNEPAAAPTTILTVINAQKNKVFAGIYKKHHHEIQEVLAPTLLSALELEPLLTEKHYDVFGDGVELISDITAGKNKFLLHDASTAFPDATLIHSHVQKNISKIAKIPWNELLPLYLRASAAEEVRAEKLSKKI